MPESAKKKIGVTLDPELHNRVKSMAPLRGLNVEKAYDQALRTWLGDPTSGSGPTVSAEEQKYLDAALYLLRESSEDIRNMVRAVLKPGIGKLKAEAPEKGRKRA